jgi:antirestriction protein ArdC
MKDKASRAHTETPRTDIYETITARLIAAIEANPGAPSMPWRTRSGTLCLPGNAVTKRPYNGINIVALWVAAETRGFSSPLWATYKQWKEIGAQVIEGSKGEPVVFYKTFQAEPDDEHDDGVRRTARSFTVFNASQVSSYQENADEDDTDLPQSPLERIAAAERFIAATGARIVYGGDRAFYRAATDHIQMPEEALFTGTATMSREESIAATELHEITHWSGASHRLNREFGKRFADKAYCFEELVAEIASCIMMAELGISAEMRADHAQYIGHWLGILKQDKRAIFAAAAKASEAVAYLKSLQPQESASPGYERLDQAA